MKVILLSGGSGKRLWPLSNDVRSKQFLKLLPAPDSGVESMIQRVVRQLRDAGIGESITIATGATQIESIRSQLGEGVNVVTEPCRRDTFPAIALSCAYLYSAGVSDDEQVVVMPCDVFTDDGYFLTLRKMAERVSADVAELVLMGIKPTYPSTKFGYVVPERKISDDCYIVKEFTEKPDSDRAEKLISQNAFWNGGVFAFRLGYLMNIVRKYSENIDFEYLRDDFGMLPKISFDYEVAEKAKSVAVVPFSGEWKDLGTWDALSGQLPSDTVGYVRTDDVSDTQVVNELDIPVVCCGVKNLIVAAGADGILVADKGHCESLKQLVGNIGDMPMYEERRWGWYKVIGRTSYPDGHNSLTRMIHVNSGCEADFSESGFRSKVITVIAGCGYVIVDGEERLICSGDVIDMKQDQNFKIRSLESLDLIEVCLK